MLPALARERRLGAGRDSAVGGGRPGPIVHRIEHLLRLTALSSGLFRKGVCRTGSSVRSLVLLAAHCSDSPAGKDECEQRQAGRFGQPAIAIGSGNPVEETGRTSSRVGSETQVVRVDRSGAGSTAVARVKVTPNRGLGRRELDYRFSQRGVPGKSYSPQGARHADVRRSGSGADIARSDRGDSNIGIVPLRVADENTFPITFQ